eukprot:Skav203899  [mRNA]  locus=scaffold1649:205569:217812:- [translate_table: standard]
MYAARRAKRRAAKAGNLAIALQMQALVGQAAKLHGFDSFQGLPSDWDHTHLTAGTFSTGGEIPSHLRQMKNVEIHVGLFSHTLGDLDQFGNAPVAFAHIDVDIFPSAIEVLSRIACQLTVGSILLYDELVNYVGFELSGEYRAWEHGSSEPWQWHAWLRLDSGLLLEHLEQVTPELLVSMPQPCRNMQEPSLDIVSTH